MCKTDTAEAAQGVELVTTEEVKASPERHRWGTELPLDNWRGWLSGSWRALLICLTVNIALQLLAGCVFHALEFEAESQHSLKYAEIRGRLDAQLQYNATVSATVDELLSHLTSIGLCSVPDVDSPNWTVVGSAYYSLTLFTTIGYGAFAPFTAGGKVATIIVGLFGIACFGYFIAVVTPMMAKLERAVVKACTSSEDGKIHNHYRRLVFSMLLGFAVVLFGAAVAKGQQHISLGNGVYFSIITLSTIGLGDFAPNGGTINASEYVCFALWAYFGIGYMSYIITIIADIALETTEMDEFQQEDLEAEAPPRERAEEGVGSLPSFGVGPFIPQR